MEEYNQLTAILSITLITMFCLLIVSLIKANRLTKENDKLKKNLNS